MAPHRSVKNHDNHPFRDLDDFPDYAQKYPSLRRFHLCDVKRGICYPNPPSLRNIERDDVLHKLSDEHCRHTTLCNADCFRDGLSTQEVKKTIKRDFCIDKLFEKYSLNPLSFRNRYYEILDVCPSERAHFEKMCNEHQDQSFYVRCDPTVSLKQAEEKVPCMSCFLTAPWN